MSFEVGSTFILILASANAANILILSGLPSFSHHKWHGVIGEGLGARDHNVTILSPYYVERPEKGVQYLFIDQNHAFTQYGNEAIKRNKKRSAITEFIYLAILTKQMCLDVIQSTAFRQLLKYPNNSFDLIIHDFTGGPCLMPFVHKFNNALLVVSTPYSYSSFLADIIGGYQYAHVPHMLLPFEKNMTFWQRSINFWLHVMEYLGREYVLLKDLDYFLPKYFGYKFPPISQLEKRAKLALINSNPIIDHLGPLLPNVIPVGGIHISDVKKLPMDLDLFLNSSKKGTILFSLGSSIRSENLPMNKQQLFIDIFSEFIDYNFLWKFESDIIVRGLPENIRIQPWIPQSDVLAHPKLKAFITHGGLLSTHEAIWRGVPMIVIPVVVDQNSNMNKVKRLEVAVGLDFYSLSYNSTKEALVRVLENPKYTINVKNLSRVLQDRNQKPLEQAIWWIEWLLRNPNIETMQSPVQTLGYFVRNSFDVIAFATIVVTLTIIISLGFLFLSCKFFFQQFPRPTRSSNEVTEHQKQQ